MKTVFHPTSEMYIPARPGRSFLKISLIWIGFVFLLQADQIAIDRINDMPNMPSPYIMRDWHDVAVTYDSLIFDFDLQGQYLPLIWWNTTPINYPDHNSFGLHTVVGTTYPSSSEGINGLAVVVGSSLCGIDKQNHYGQDWVLMCEEYFNNRPEENVYLNHPVSGSGDDWWYDTMPNIFFYQLYDLYPDTGDFENQLFHVANQWLTAVTNMGGVTTPWQLPDMYHRAWYLSTMTPNDSGVPQPEAAGAISWLLYHAYIETGNEDYRVGAELAMEYLDGLLTNPSYELQLAYGAQIAARMNAELGTDYDLEKMVNWCFDIGPLRNWGAIIGNWGGYDCSGLIGEATPFYGYAFAMNTFEQIGALVPLVRYDERYADAIGKWVLNAANASRLFYTEYLPDSHQDSEGWAHQYDPNSVIAHEGLRQSQIGMSPFATGDAISGGWGMTNLALYGSSHVGILGGIIDTTEVEGVLILDLNRTDYFQDDSYPTKLVYNPHPIDHDIVFPLDDSVVDIYDLVQNTFISTGQSGTAVLSIPAQSARVVVQTPSGGTVSYDQEMMLVNDRVIDYHSGNPVVDYRPRIKSLAPMQNPVEPGTTITIYCTATDREGEDLTYDWSTEGGDLSGSGSQVDWTAPMMEMDATVSVTVTDSGSNSQNKSIDIHVLYPVNEAPEIQELTASNRKLHLSSSALITCSAEDPENSLLNYSWSSVEGEFYGDGESVTWQAPITVGNYWLYCQVSDNFGAAVLDSLLMAVRDFTNYSPGTELVYLPFYGNADDQSGNGNHGIVSGAVLTYGYNGIPASAYYFDGINDNIRLPNNDLLNCQEGITVSYFMRIDQFFDREAYPISHGNWENRWKASITNQRLRWTIKTDHTLNSGIVDLDSDDLLETGQFYHVALTYNGSDVEIYLDGQLNGISEWQGNLLATFYDLTIAKVLPTSNSYNFKGVLDEVHIFDYALPIQSIQALSQGQTCYHLGDSNQDDAVDVLDIVELVSLILDGIPLDTCQILTMDINNDGSADIIDVVMLVMIILDL